MKINILFIAIIALLCQSTFGQTRTIYGRVISQVLEVVPLLTIQNTNSLKIGETDFNGQFKIDIPKNTDTLLFCYIGMETTTLKLSNQCDTVEVIMLYAAHYDFMSSKKVDKLRLVEFYKLPELYKLAIKKGLFYNENICYKREFEPIKPELDKIGQRMKEIEKQNKLTFKKLAIGDTILIPYSVNYNKTNEVSLSYWSSYTNETNFNCLIEGVVTKKYKQKNGYNLTYKVTDCEKCKYDSIKYKGENMEVGKVFEHNMRIFKVIKK